MVRNLSAGRPTRLWLVALALLVGVGAFVATPAPVPAREVTNTLPWNHVCVDGFGGLFPARPQAAPDSLPAWNMSTLSSIWTPPPLPIYCPEKSGAVQSHASGLFPPDMTPQIVRVAPLLLGNLLGWNSGDPLTRPVVPGPVSVEFQRDTLLLEIGVIAVDRNQIFGNIRDVDVDGDGNILILDDQDFSLSWFGPDGRFRGRTGRHGGGPSEFRAPAGLAVSPAGQIYVLDAASRKIAEFALGEEGLEFVRSFPVPVYGSDMCLVDGRLVVLGQVSDGTPKVYILSEEGEVIRSFWTRLSAPATSSWPGEVHSFLCLQSWTGLCPLRRRGCPRDCQRAPGHRALVFYTRRLHS